MESKSQVHVSRAENKGKLIRAIKPQPRSQRRIEASELASISAKRKPTVYQARNMEFPDETLKTVKANISKDFELMEKSYVKVEELPTQVVELRRLARKSRSSKKTSHKSKRSSLNLVFLISVSIFALSASAFFLSNSSFDSPKRVAAVSFQSQRSASQIERRSSVKKGASNEKSFKRSKVSKTKKRERPLQD